MRKLGMRGGTTASHAAGKELQTASEKTVA